MSDELEKLVIIESPFRGKNYEETSINILYARACVHDSLLKGEFPFASHLFYTQDGILDDKIEVERMLGINAGVAWGKQAKTRAVYMDRGISQGMEYGVKAGEKSGQIIIYRNLPNYEEWLENVKKLNLNEGYKFEVHNGKYSEKVKNSN